jgi:hypothetical protein
MTEAEAASAEVARAFIQVQTGFADPFYGRRQELCLAGLIMF